MVNIKDLEEKKLILNYMKLCTNKNLKNILCNNSVYGWWKWKWQDDFIVNGKPLQIFRNKFVLSATKDRKGIEPPEIYKEYQKIIDEVSKWMLNNYNKKWSRKVNKQKAGELLVEYRKECAAELENLISLKESDYTVKYIHLDADSKGFVYLINYNIISNGESIFSGTYDEVKDYLNTEKLNTEQ